MTREEALKQAISRAGGQAALARMMGLFRQHVHVWKIAPVFKVLEIERLTGVSRHDLRPDIYPREERLADEGFVCAFKTTDS